MPARTATDSSSTHMPALPPTLEEEHESGKDTSEASVGARPSSEETRAPPSTKPIYPPSQFSSFHYHRNSGSTSASDSTASSPVTAPSLTDSYLNGDTPVTSPDTPASSLPPYSPAFTLATNPAVGSKPDLLRQLPAPKELPRPSTGPKKPRNLKNLAVDTSGTVPLGRAVSTASLPLKHSADSGMISLAPTPSSLGPPQPTRRKSSQLGLKLVTTPSQSPIRQQVSSFPPPTPSLIRPSALRHFPSSPLLPLKSPSAPPAGGMQLPPLANPPAAAVDFSEAPVEQLEDDDARRFDIPQSREIKVAAYPDGPICIYDPHVYLYFEPTAAEASKFGVVLNVASEVVNPFKTKPPTTTGGAKNNLHDAMKSSTESSPTSPKAGDTPAKDPLVEPEYIHVPWEHNTDIVPELHGLSKLVDERVQDGKSVLIHCQCGVSRSASLIVAYGLYKNPSITVQEAYDAVKRRSKWINPNMNLIMQLQEFRTELLKTSAGMPSKAKHNTSTSISSKRGGDESTTRSMAHRDRSSIADDRPKSAPLPPETPKTGSALTTRDDSGLVSPGPSSAPLDFTWPTKKNPRAESEPSSAYTTPQESPSASQQPTSTTQTIPSSEKPNILPSSTIEQNVPGMQAPSSTAPDASSQASAVRSAPNASALESRVDDSATVSADSAASKDTEAKASENNVEYSGLSKASHNSTAKSHLPTPLQSIHNVPRLSARKSQPLPRLKTKYTSPSQFVLSPRADEFAMTSVVQPPSDDSFGLTSPRATTTFTAQLPHHGEPSTEVRAATSRDMQTLGANLPSNKLKPQPGIASTTEASDRATMRSRLGMSTSSSYDMRSEYVLAAKARELRPSVPVLRAVQQPQPQHQSDTNAARNDLSDALLSPRATEITANPFESAMAAYSHGDGKADSGNQAPKLHTQPEAGTAVGAAPLPAAPTEDPRSPPQRGISPIVRSIFGALS